jgi:mono/diheme cytochrome c family protein
MKKVLGSILGVAAAGILGGILYFFHHFPDVGPADGVKLDLSQERMERGRYLAHHVAVCIDCHSTRNWDYYSGPAVAGTEGRGGEFFGRDFGFPGHIYARNITPAAIGSWSDGELLRAITCGVSKDGRALFPLMPYPRYATADEEDIRAIAAYIRTLPPIENRVQATKLDFPMNLIVRTIPAAPKFAPRPPREDSVAYGAYLANMAACAECHTQQEKGQPLPGMDYAGGFAFILPWGTVRSSNITPDAETGIGAWSKEQFIARFKTYASEAARKMEMKPPYNEAYFNTIMPWTMYAGMTEEDLSAIYAYLRTIRPVRNKVQKYSAEGATFVSGR